MSDFLATIMKSKRRRVEHAAAATPLAQVRREADAVRQEAKPFALRRALESSPDINIIAEFKRASPSKGVIHEDASLVAVARAYQAGGARAISVLTEEDYFQGSLDDLRAARRSVELPVLRKDFVFDEFQIYESAAAGADAVLLIVAALDRETLLRLRRVAEQELKLDALVEVHTADELHTALECGATLIGVNNRNLHTFDVSLDVSAELAPLTPPGVVLISESGLRTKADLHNLRALGFSGFLIGESLMRAIDPQQALRELLASESNQHGELSRRGD